jgi:hypothetical protein
MDRQSAFAATFSSPHEHGQNRQEPFPIARAAERRNEHYTNRFDS